MSRHRRLARVCLVAATLIVAAASTAVSEDALSAARDLYAAAAYEDALTMLNRLQPSGASAEERRTIEQYRAFCLLALGRPTEAERAIEAVVTAAPSYHPSDADVSPRVRSAFSDVRKRMLPAIVQRQYGEAKTAYDQKQFATAADLFARVLALLSDPDLVAVANQSPFSDLRTLADGFRDLSAKAATPPPPPPPPPPPAPASTPAPPPMPVVPRIYSLGEANVAPPVAVRQAVPDYPRQPVPRVRGIVEIVIDETGAVETAVMRAPVNAMYDRLALAAAKAWRYKPATLGGVPVKFRKEIVIAFKP